MHWEKALIELEGEYTLAWHTRNCGLWD